MLYLRNLEYFLEDGIQVPNIKGRYYELIYNDSSMFHHSINLLNKYDFLFIDANNPFLIDDEYIQLFNSLYSLDNKKVHWQLSTYRRNPLTLLLDTFNNDWLVHHYSLDDVLVFNYNPFVLDLL
jgi:hypothetical protein